MEQNTEYVRQLIWALEYVEANGFGDCVDADSIIEEAARAYLSQIDSSGAPDS